jgi:hypothetical protein
VTLALRDLAISRAFSNAFRVEFTDVKTTKMDDSDLAPGWMPGFPGTSILNASSLCEQAIADISTRSTGKLTLPGLKNAWRYHEEAAENV